MENPIIKLIVGLLSVGVIGWGIVGLIALFVKWTWWVEEGSWLQYLPILIPSAIAILVCIVGILVGITNYVIVKK